MVCTANDLQEWKDFPKGLRVLLLDGDSTSASQITSKLEAMDYIVTTFCNETEALSAFSSNPESFHVAIVEVNASNSHWGFQFLETAKDLPIIMTSNIHCLSTMMKCIALGAVEFLRKPLCEDKLRNIWQHVVHKAFNAGGSVISESIKPVKESVVSMLQIKQENEEQISKISIETENVSKVHESDHEQSPGSEKYPAPSTPQLKQGSQLLDDGDCQDQTNCLSEKESGEQDIVSKSVENTCANSIAEVQMGEAHMPQKTVVKEEGDSADRSNMSRYPHNRDNANDIGHPLNRSSANSTDQPHNRDTANGTGDPHNRDSANDIGHPNNRDSTNDIGGAAEKLSKASGLNHSSKSNRKKMKVDWTPELHKKFVQAVEQLGVDQAIPSRILELMKAEGLTRHNVASHLQKYRMNKRHILPKEDDRRLHHLRDPIQRSYYPQKPIMAFPPYHYNNALPIAPAYPMWGSQPVSHPASVQMWGSYPQWQPSESWHWKPYPELQADTWGCPVMPPLQGGYSAYPQNAAGFHNASVVDNGCSMPNNSFNHHPAEEVVDKVMKEAISKPWLPLPLGLKPPSTDGVLAELSRQGICSIPPQTNGSIAR